MRRQKEQQSTQLQSCKYDNAGTNAKPVVIPELAEWYGGTEAGTVKIGEGTKIVYKDAAFKAAAEALAEDYKAEYGVDLQVVDSGEDAGDIVFAKDDKNGLGEEGYIMEMDDKVNVKAEQAQGAYWSTRSILQIVKLNNGEIPKGITKDYPKFKVRSFSLDVARKPASLDSLEDFVDAMAYYKMNDFQVHLNDNLIFYESFTNAEVARERAYTGFRLESSIKEGGENKKDLTNEDLFYTKEAFKNFIEESEAQGVSIVPEIDAPGHSGAFTKVRPDLMLPQNKVVSGVANRAGEQFDLSGDVTSPDSQYSKSLKFVQGVWDEYLTDNMFDDSMTVHIGTDEYYGEENAFRHFSDDMIKFIQSKDRTVRMWGSLTQLDGDGTVPVTSDNVQLNVWNTGYSNPKQMYNDGFDLINTLDGTLYMVPNGSGGKGGYGDYLNTESLYTSWIRITWAEQSFRQDLIRCSEVRLQSGMTISTQRHRVFRKLITLSVLRMRFRFLQAKAGAKAKILLLQTLLRRRKILEMLREAIRTLKKQQTKTVNICLTVSIIKKMLPKVTEISERQKMQISTAR